MENKEIQLYWQNFLNTQTRLDKNQEFEEAWSFGDSSEMADELLQLVLAGKKTATSSAYTVYKQEGEDLPLENSLSIILDGRGKPCCVVETKRVSVIQYSAISEIEAAKEGEGDLTLAYWQKAHENFWRNNLKSYGLTFTPDMLVVFEEFRVVYQ